MESTLLFHTYKMWRVKMIKAAPDEFKQINERFGSLAALRIVAEKVYGEKIMEGLW
jgi:hypothetical protein